MTRNLSAIGLLLLASACRQDASVAPPGNDNAPVAEADEAAQPAPATAGNATVSTPGPTPAAAPQPGANVSAFSSLDLKRCRLIEKNEEEGGYFRHRCPAPAGYEVDHVESDLRQSLTLRRGGQVTGLNLTAVTGDGGFSTLGRTLEWRGPAGAPPRTLTLRYNVHNEDRPDRPGSLVVVRLDPRPCAIAVVPSAPGQSEAARAIADAPTLRDCLAR